ncbi:hypothetical protein K502DRAFT_95883 [Neoconidiobolus thromboides FSU 785]|nr:hypothetical protein K502DRAFT_95883 [Neoconidiobolus thromboides FSU 785]
MEFKILFIERIYEHILMNEENEGVIQRIIYETREFIKYRNKVDSELITYFTYFKIKLFYYINNSTSKELIYQLLSFIFSLTKEYQFNITIIKLEEMLKLLVFLENKQTESKLINLMVEIISFNEININKNGNKKNINYEKEKNYLLRLSELDLKASNSYLFYLLKLIDNKEYIIQHVNCFKNELSNNINNKRINKYLLSYLNSYLSRFIELDNDNDNLLNDNEEFNWLNLNFVNRMNSLLNESDKIILFQLLSTIFQLQDNCLVDSDIYNIQQHHNYIQLGLELLLSNNSSNKLNKKDGSNIIASSNDNNYTIINYFVKIDYYNDYVKLMIVQFKYNIMKSINNRELVDKLNNRIQLDNPYNKIEFDLNCILKQLEFILLNNTYLSYFVNNNELFNHFINIYHFIIYCCVNHIDDIIKTEIKLIIQSLILCLRIYIRYLIDKKNYQLINRNLRLVVKIFQLKKKLGKENNNNSEIVDNIKLLNSFFYLFFPPLLPHLLLSENQSNLTYFISHFSYLELDENFNHQENNIESLLNQQLNLIQILIPTETIKEVKSLKLATKIITNCISLYQKYYESILDNENEVNLNLSIYHSFIYSLL